MNISFTMEKYACEIFIVVKKSRTIVSFDSNGDKHKKDCTKLFYSSTSLFEIYTKGFIHLTEMLTCTPTLLAHLFVAFYQRFKQTIIENVSIITFYGCFRVICVSFASRVIFETAICCIPICCVNPIY